MISRTRLTQTTFNQWFSFVKNNLNTEIANVSTDYGNPTYLAPIKKWMDWLEAGPNLESYPALMAQVDSLDVVDESMGSTVNENVNVTVAVVFSGTSVQDGSIRSMLYADAFKNFWDTHRDFGGCCYFSELLSLRFLRDQTAGSNLATLEAKLRIRG